MKKSITILNYTFVLLSFICWSYIAFRIFSYQENHVGWNILHLNILFAVIAITSIVSYMQTKQTIKIIFFMYALISAGLIYYCYTDNILIPYEVWVERGMPER